MTVMNFSQFIKQISINNKKLTIKGTLMQIWKSPYLFYFI